MEVLHINISIEDTLDLATIADMIPYDQYRTPEGKALPKLEYVLRTPGSGVSSKSDLKHFFKLPVSVRDSIAGKLHSVSFTDNVPLPKCSVRSVEVSDVNNSYASDTSGLYVKEVKYHAIKTKLPLGDDGWGPASYIYPPEELATPVLPDTASGKIAYALTDDGLKVVFHEDDVAYCIDNYNVSYTDFFAVVYNQNQVFLLPWDYFENEFLKR